MRMFPFFLFWVSPWFPSFRGMLTDELINAEAHAILNIIEWQAQKKTY